MSFSYDDPPTGALRQGEIIQGLYELRVKVAQAQAEIGETHPLQRVDHNFAMVMTPDCDLQWDYEARSEQGQLHKLVQHVLFCDAFTHEEIINRGGLNAELRRRIKSQQHERYHYLPVALIGADPKSGLPELYIDFKMAFGLATEYVYSLLNQPGIARKAVVPVIYVQQLSDRFSFWIGRVGLPDEPPL